VTLSRSVYHVALQARDSAGNLGIAAGAVVNRCLAPGLALSATRLGPLRLGETTDAVAAATPPAHGHGVARSICVQGGGRVYFSTIESGAPVGVLASSAPTEGFAHASRAGTLASRGAGIYSARRHPGLVLATRHGRVRVVAIVQHSLRTHPRALRAALKRLL
jgi:hypothetical protein